jgi:hypothetical protein
VVLEHRWQNWDYPFSLFRLLLLLFFILLRFLLFRLNGLLSKLLMTLLPYVFLQTCLRLQENVCFPAGGQQIERMLLDLVRLQTDTSILLLPVLTRLLFVVLLCYMIVLTALLCVLRLLCTIGDGLER